MIDCRSVILPLFLCLIAVPVSAANLDCAKADTQAVVNLCAAKELKDADDELARVSKALSKDLKDPAARAALDQAGKAWEAYRDAECRFKFERRHRQRRRTDGRRLLPGGARANPDHGLKAHPRLQEGRCDLSRAQALSRAAAP